MKLILKAAIFIVFVVEPSLRVDLTQSMEKIQKTIAKILKIFATKTKYNYIFVINFSYLYVIFI